jgi:hypothetical protein
MVPSITELVGGQVQLIVAGRVHEYEAAALLVEELHLPLFDVGRLELLVRTERALDHRSGEHVSELGARERVALARFDELEVDHAEGNPVELDLQILLDVGGLVHAVFS